MKIEELKNMIANGVDDIFDDGDDFDEGEESMLMMDDGPDSEDEDVPKMATKKKRSGMGYVKSNDKQEGPITKEPPSEYVMEMHKRAVNNSALLTKNPHNACGCFHCKRIFAEKHVRVRGKTLYCPYCGEPSVLTSTDTYQVSDGMLWRLWAYYYAFGKREDSTSA